MEIRSYPHPKQQMLKIWDIPGVGTDLFLRSTYLADIDVDRYDFFLLITASRFTENDTWLGKEIHKRHKKHFFVRTKIGVDVNNDSEAHPNTCTSEEAVIETIRHATEKQLRENGFDDVPVFLIDNHKNDKFDFEKLKQQLLKDFPELKRSAIIFSLQSTNKEMIKIKVAELRSRIKWRAALSAAGGVVPIPGVATAVDIAIVTSEASFYFEQLGLDRESLQRYAKLHSVDCDRLQSIVSRALGIKAPSLTLEGMKTVVLAIVTSNASIFAGAAIGNTTKMFLPLIGGMIAAPLSFGGTYLALKVTLNKFEATALEVMQFVTDRATRTDEAETSEETTSSKEADDVDESPSKKQSTMWRYCNVM